MKKEVIEEINQNDLMRKKDKKICTALNYVKQLFILPSVATRCVSMFTFTFLVGISIKIASSIYAITSEIKKHKSVIKKKRKTPDKIILSVKTKS